MVLVKQNVGEGAKFESPSRDGEELRSIKPLDLLRDLLNERQGIKDLIREVFKVVDERSQDSEGSKNSEDSEGWERRELLAQVCVVASVEGERGVEWLADILISLGDPEVLLEFREAFQKRWVTYQSDGLVITTDFDFESPRIAVPPMIRDATGRVIDCLIFEKLVARIRIHDRLNCVLVEFR